MKHELILIADKLENGKCNTHAEKATRLFVVRFKLAVAAMNINDFSNGK